VKTDNLFDDGVVNDHIEAQRIKDLLLSIMNDDTPRVTARVSKPAIITAHDDIYLRVRASSPPTVTQRFAASIRRYATGLVEQVHSESGPERTTNVTIDEMLNTRRRTIGVEPIFPLLENARRLDLPDAVFEHWTIRELQRIVIDLVIYSNDVVSYRKEEAEGNPHNLIAMVRREGRTAQQAFDVVGSMLDVLYGDWTVAFEAVPSWGGQVDRDVAQYIQGIKNVAVGNVNWSFHSERYFGKMTVTVKETLVTDVLADIVVPVAA